MKTSKGVELLRLWRHGWHGQHLQHCKIVPVEGATPKEALVNIILFLSLQNQALEDPILRGFADI